jgi:hypothetical protein
MKPNWTHGLLLIVGLVLGCLLCKQCGDCSVTETTTIDTLYQDTGRVVFTDVPQPFEVIKWQTRWLHDTTQLTVTDTPAFVESCLETVNYFQVYDTNEVKIGLHISVFRNRLDSLRLEVSNVRPTTIVTNTTTVNKQRAWGIDLGLGAGISPDGKVRATASLIFGRRIISFRQMRGMN